MMNCPVCQSSDALHLGTLESQPVVANDPRDDPEKARAVKRADIDFVRCRGCGHHYNRNFVPFAYPESYENSLAHSPSMQVHLAKEAERIVEFHGINGGRRVVEIGCGRRPSFLCQVVSSRNEAVGYDPAYDPLFPLPSNITIVREEFRPDLLTSEVDLVIARHVVEHLENPTEFLSRLQTRALHLELPAFPKSPWELVYEHPSCFTESSLVKMVEEAGFQVTELATTFGGNFLRLDAVRPFTDSYAEVETHSVLDFEVIDRWNRILSEMEDVAIWGAGTRGITFLNAIAEPGRIRHAGDLNPEKQGRFVAGTGHVIVSPEALEARHVIIMNPNYEAEIRAQLSGDVSVHLAI